MRAARFAFRRDGAAWVSGDATLVTRATADGFTVTPFHHAPDPRRRATRGTSLRVATTALGRGVARPVPAAEPAAQPDGAVAFARGEAVEHLRVTTGGAEQSWSFAARPGGAGDLAVRVRVEGLAYRGATARGLHFADAATGLGVRYSHATWVDADGVRSDVPAAWEGGEVALRVPARVLDASRFPAVLDPTVSPEFGVDRLAVGPAPGAQRAPAAAWDGAVYLAVWEDDRGGDADVYAARVSARGDVLDPAGIAVATGPAAQRAPRGAFDGADFVVVWEDLRGGDADVFAARVTSAGVVRDRVAVASGAGHQGAPAVASDGSGALVAWEHEDDGRFVTRAARVSAGAVLDATPIELPSGAGSQRAPVAAWSGAHYLVAWEDFRGDGDVYAARVAADGAVLDPAGVAVSAGAGAQLAPGVACGLDECFVAWADLRDGVSYDVFGARVAADGAVLDAVGVPVVRAPEAQFAPAVAWDGGRYLVAWQDARVDGVSADLRAARVDPVEGAAAADFAVSAAVGDQVTPSLVAGGGQVLALWDDRRAGREEGDVRAARIGLPEFVLDPAGRIVSAAAAQERAPAVAFDGGDYLVVWEARRALGDVASWDLLGMRVSPSGAVLDPAGLAIAADPDADERAPAVAWDGAHHLVAWEQRAPLGVASVRVRRFGADGLPADDVATALASGWGDQRAPTVAAGPAGWLVAWQDGRSFFGWDVYGAFVDAGGTHAAEPFAVSDAVNDQSMPRAACEGARYLVAWRAAVGGCGADAGCDPDLDPFCEFTCDADPTHVDVHAAWVNPLRAAAGPRFAVTAAAGEQTRPAVAAGAGAFFVAWEDRRGADADVRGVSIVSGAAEAGAEVTISAAPGAQGAPSVAFGGGLFGVAWQDGRVGDGDVYAARVLPTGAVLDPTGLPVATDPAAESSPAFALSPGGAGLVAYARFEAAPPYGTDRVRARTVSFGGEVGASCREAAECGTGLCAGGLCCPSACDDGDPCTDDGCATGACSHVRRDTPACVADAGTTEVGVPDAGDDASVPGEDASASDVGVPGEDGGVIVVVDAATPDAAPAEDGSAPVEDAMSVEDGGSPTPDATPAEDAGSTPTDDAATPADDAATPSDDGAFSSDAGPSPEDATADAGPSPGDAAVPVADVADAGDGAPRPGFDCGCSVPGSSSPRSSAPAAALAALAFAGLRRRRR